MGEARGQSEGGERIATKVDGVQTTQVRRETEVGQQIAGEIKGFQIRQTRRDGQSAKFVVGKAESYQIAQVSVERNVAQGARADIEISQGCESWGHAVVREQVGAETEKMEVRQIGRELNAGELVETEIEVGQSF